MAETPHAVPHHELGLGLWLQCSRENWGCSTVWMTSTMLYSSSMNPRALWPGPCCGEQEEGEGLQAISVLPELECNCCGDSGSSGSW